MRHVSCNHKFLYTFYQCGSTASYASAGIARSEMSVRLSVTLRYCIKNNKAIVSRFFTSGEPEDSVFADITFILKFERSNPERERFMRLGQ